MANTSTNGNFIANSTGNRTEKLGILRTHPNETIDPLAQISMFGFLDTDDSGISFKTRVSGVLEERMMIDGKGNVGIGTPGPVGKLTVSQDKATYDERDNHLRLQGSTDPTKMLSLGFHTTDNIGWIQSLQYGKDVKPLVLQPNGGNVGIGKSPSDDIKLDVKGKVNAEYFYGDGFNLSNINASKITGMLSDSLIPDTISKTDHKHPDIAPAVHSHAWWNPIDKCSLGELPFDPKYPIRNYVIPDESIPHDATEVLVYVIIGFGYHGDTKGTIGIADYEADIEFEISTQIPKYYHVEPFRWEKALRCDMGKLRETLVLGYGLEWVKTANIEKIDNGRTIKVSMCGKNILLMKLEETKATLTLNNVRFAEWVSKYENGYLIVYPDRWWLEKIKYAHYIYAHSYSQAAWSFNSGTFWLPLTYERKIYVNLSSNPSILQQIHNRKTGIYLIGWR